MLGSRLVVLLLPLLTAFVVSQPSGWDELPEATSPIAGFEARAFHAPDDRDTTYVVARPSGVARDAAASFSEIIDDLGARAIADGWKLVSRQHVIDGAGRIIDDVYLSSPTLGGEHDRLARSVVGGKLQVLYGRCRGHGPPMAACESRLVDLDVPAEPGLDLSMIAIIAIGIAAAALALAGLGVVVRRARRRRALVRSQPLVDGEIVTIAGSVQAAATARLEAPLSGRACVAHRSRMRVYTTEATPRLAWEPTERGAAPFVVATRHGPIHIGDELELAFAPSVVVDTHAPRLRAFRDRHGVTREASVAFDEQVIPVGARVELRGAVVVERVAAAANAPERGYRDAPTVTRLAGPITILRVW